MRDVKISEDKTIEIKALTRGQVKKLRADGFNLIALTTAQAEEAMDAVFEIALTADDIETLNGLPYPEALSVWRAILAETYGAPEEQKNS